MSKFLDVLSILKTKKFWVELVIMTVAMMIGACAVYYFLVPSKLIIGSISGLSIVISGVSESLFGIALPVSTVILVLNVILLVLAYFLVGKEFGAKTVYTALILGPMMRFLELHFPYENYIQQGAQCPTIMGDIWFDLCCFVIMLSASQAVLFKINASSGGLDILAKIVNKYLHFDIGASVSIAGAIICCTAFAINPFYMVAIGLIGTWINGIVVNYFTAGLNNRKRVTIVTKDYETLRHYIVKDLKSACTLHEVIGGTSNTESVELQTLLGKDEFAKLIDYIGTNEVNAFVTADNVSEVYGFWQRVGKIKKMRKLRARKR